MMRLPGLMALVALLVPLTAAAQEWPMMARHAGSLSALPQHLAEAVQVALALKPGNPGQEIAQRGIYTALEDALDARRQRIIVSLSRSISPNGCAFRCRRSACLLP